MLQPLLNSNTIPLLEKIAIFGERRHEVLVGNIANIDTVDYKTRDLPVEEFRAALKAAIGDRQPQSLGNSSSSRTLEQLFPKKMFQAIEASPSNITFQDGGNRSIEHEVMEMTKNSMLQGFALELMSVQMQMLQAVIQERP